MRPRTILTTIAAILALAACGSDEPLTSESHRAQYCAEHDIPDAICALNGTSERIECKHGPWAYTVRRDNWGATIDCAVRGDYAEAEFVGATRRWVPDAASEQVVLNLAEDPSEWPAAECLLDPVVYATDAPSQATPDQARPEVRLAIAPDGTAALSSNDPVFAPAFAFAPEECKRSN